MQRGITDLPATEAEGEDTKISSEERHETLLETGEAIPIRHNAENCNVGWLESEGLFQEIVAQSTRQRPKVGKKTKVIPRACTRGTRDLSFHS